LTGTSPSSNGVPAPRFEVGISRREDSLLVSVSGEFDLDATREFKLAMSELAVEGLRSVEIDLRKVTFIDSSGLRMLVEVVQVARERDLAVRIVRGGSPVDRVFQLSGLDKVLPLAEAEAGA
jgi:anti-sigma B factor antagonist